MNIDKAAIKNEFQRHERDTGSSEVQIAILTKEIAALQPLRPAPQGAEPPQAP